MAKIGTVGGQGILETGRAVFMRTVTHYYTGRIVDWDADGITLTEAAWVADTGRFSAALESGKLSEVEPFPDDVWINRGAVIDMTPWRHDLPRAVK